MASAPCDALADQGHLEVVLEGADLAAGGAAGLALVGAGEGVPGAGEGAEVGAAAVAVRGEHRADAAALVDVGADDDAVGADAAEHGLPWCALGMASTELRRRWALLRRLAIDSRDSGVRRRVRAMGRPDRPLRLLVAAFGDPGHAFPAIALARELGRRGHEVLVETWERWREAVEARGAGVHRRAGVHGVSAAGAGHARWADGRGRGAGAGEVDGGVRARPGGERHPHAGADARRGGGRGAARDADPARLSGAAAGDAALLARAAAAADGGWAGWRWRATGPLLGMGLRRGRDELNETRGRLGLPPIERFHGGISELLAIVATFPQLEYPREWPAHVRVTGPLFFELAGEEVEIPEGDGPLVLIAPSTSQDPECELLRVALDGLADEPVRVLATTNRHRPERPIEVPDNATLVDWLLYSQAMPAADVVICHGGHGTVARALAAGKPLLVCPSVGDMGENAARVAWSGTGLSVPRRLLSRQGDQAGDAAAAERAESFRAAALAVAEWSERSRRSCGRRGARRGGGPERDEPALAGSYLVVLSSSGGGTRTHNLSVNSRVLYRLSYPGSPATLARQTLA